jgi:hypothetical protein
LQLTLSIRLSKAATGNSSVIYRPYSCDSLNDVVPSSVASSCCIQGTWIDTPGSRAAHRTAAMAYCEFTGSITQPAGSMKQAQVILQVMLSDCPTHAPWSHAAQVVSEIRPRRRPACLPLLTFEENHGTGIVHVIQAAHTSESLFRSQPAQYSTVGPGPGAAAAKRYAGLLCPAGQHCWHTPKRLPWAARSPWGDVVG